MSSDSFERMRVRVKKALMSPDPFIVIGKIPKNKAYQWIALSVLGDKELATRFAGWKAVPPKRHPLMPREKGRIVVGNQYLAEKLASLVLEERAEEFKHAKEAASSYDGCYTKHTIGELYQPPRPKTEEKHESGLSVLNGKPYAKFYVEIGLVLTLSQIDSALALGIDFHEYARRTLLMCPGLLVRRDWGVFDDSKIPIFELLDTVRCTDP